ncbi:unnamed protein product [Kluyveromyces dobzhanskii CBS 2104]|uniref:WGS project CCBQ000000000 data, contig 00106 n=1 Tax=Kluyveromyces dobzhanskii CBS 2104 TaxID=1427455 RepID=A0A0A8L5M6_9SACH|nr:unnamed protein product [Kluyveromyces dobzhanskii CBS 2104]
MAGPSVRQGDASNDPQGKRMKDEPNQGQENTPYNNNDIADPFVYDAMAKNSKQLLYAHIYNYLVQNHHLDTAKKFLQEANVPLSREVPQYSMNGDKLLNSKMLMNSPDTFLLEWWQSLWALNEYVETTPNESLTNLKHFNERTVPILPQVPPQEFVPRVERSGSTAPMMGVPNNLTHLQQQQQQHMRSVPSPGSIPASYGANANSFLAGLPVQAPDSFQSVPANTPTSGLRNVPGQSSYNTTVTATLGSSKSTPKAQHAISGAKGKQAKKGSTNNKGRDPNIASKTQAGTEAKSTKGAASSAKVKKASPSGSRQVQANWTKLQQQQQQQQQQQIRIQYQEMMTMMQQQQQQQQQQQRQPNNPNILPGQGNASGGPGGSQQYIQQQGGYEDVISAQQPDGPSNKDPFSISLPGQQSQNVDSYGTHNNVGLPVSSEATDKNTKAQPPSSMDPFRSQDFNTLPGSSNAKLSLGQFDMSGLSSEFIGGWKQ